MSYCGSVALIISIAQQAKPIVSGQTLELCAQRATSSSFPRRNCPGITATGNLLSATRKRTRSRARPRRHHLEQAEDRAARASARPTGRTTPPRRRGSRTASQSDRSAPGSGRRPSRSVRPRIRTACALAGFGLRRASKPGDQAKDDRQGEARLRGRWRRAVGTHRPSVSRGAERTFANFPAMSRTFSSSRRLRLGLLVAVFAATLGDKGCDPNYIGVQDYGAITGRVYRCEDQRSDLRCAHQRRLAVRHALRPTGRIHASQGADRNATSRDHRDRLPNYRADPRRRRQGQDGGDRAAGCADVKRRSPAGARPRGHRSSIPGSDVTHSRRPGNPRADRHRSAEVSWSRARKICRNCTEAASRFIEPA